MHRHARFKRACTHASTKPAHVPALHTLARVCSSCLHSLVLGLPAQTSSCTCPHARTGTPSAHPH
eukprot:4130921-Alexandrium_andersonii.AAC.1